MNAERSELGKVERTALVYHRDSLKAEIGRKGIALMLAAHMLFAWIAPMHFGAEKFAAIQLVGEKLDWLARYAPAVIGLMLIGGVFDRRLQVLAGCIVTLFYIAVAASLHDWAVQGIYIVFLCPLSALMMIMSWDPKRWHE